MGTEVLRPQDCLSESFRVSPAPFNHHRKYYPAAGNGFGYNRNIINNTTICGHRNPAVVRTVQKKKSHQQDMTNPKRLPISDDFKVVRKHTKNICNQNNDFPMGKVTILRRGESLDFLNQHIKKDHSNRKMNNMETTSGAADLVPSGMQRLDPLMPETFPTQIRFGLPDTMYAGSAFFSSPSPSDLPLPTFFKKHQSFDDSATRDLRRLLRIE